MRPAVSLKNNKIVIFGTQNFSARSIKEVLRHKKHRRTAKLCIQFMNYFMFKVTTSDFAVLPYLSVTTQ